LAFLAADIALAAVWYFAYDDDPNSTSYVPEDWKDLVLANLGISAPATVPVQFVGTWKTRNNDIVIFQPRGDFSYTETFPNSQEVRVQSTGRIYAADRDYITVKTTTLQRIRVNQAPERSSDGWSLALDGKQYKKFLDTPSL
jgi:hypothetical protein